MSELRRNPTTRQWVIISGERSARPHEYARPSKRREVPAYLKRCPFCGGNEALTPSAVLEIPDPADAGQWQIRGFPNKYAALSPTPPTPDTSQGPLFLAIPGEGAHEVLVESPVHNRFPATRSEEEMALLMEAYQQRYLALVERPSTRYVLVFKNQGKEAGTSIEHPHSQIIATPVVPESALKRGTIAGEHYRQTGQCLYCQIAAEELQLARRIVYCDERFVVFHPFAASRPAETWIVPLDHQPTFGMASKEELTRFGSVLLRTLQQLSAGFGDPGFNYAIHSCPRGMEDDSYWHWHLQLIPRLTKAAGFELGSGIYINTAPPEKTAEIMRQALAERTTP